MQTVLNYSTIPYKLASFVANVSHVPDTNFQENSSDGNRDIAEKVYCSSSALNYSSIPNKLSFVVNVRGVQHQFSVKSLQWKPRRYTALQVPLIIDRA